MFYSENASNFNEVQKEEMFILWIKVHKDLLLTLSEILTASFFFFLFGFVFFLREKESAREGKTSHLLRSCGEWINAPSRQPESSWVF